MATLKQKIKLIWGILGNKTALTGPFSVTVDVTRRCNLRCSGCRFHSPYVNIPSPCDQTVLDIPLHAVKELCAELKTMGTGNLIITGEGEPFLHPHLFDIISTVKGSGLHATLLTNGTLLDKTNINLLIDSQLDILKVSLWVGSPEGYEQNYPGASPDNFRKTVDGLKLLTKFKAKYNSKLPFIVVHQPINRYNFLKIDTMLSLVYTAGCNALSFSPLKSLRGRLNWFALSPIEEKSLRSSLVRMKKQLKLLSINHNIDQTLLRYRIGEAVWKKLPCYIPWFHARVTVDGAVLPCNNPCDLQMGNLNKNSFYEIWNGSAFHSFRKRTLTRKGLISVGKHCDCGFCCHVDSNLRVHRFLRCALSFRHWINN